MVRPTRFDSPVVFGDTASFTGTLSLPAGVIGNAQIPAGAGVEFEKLEHLHRIPFNLFRIPVRQTVRSIVHDLDDNATVNSVILRPAVDITLKAGRIVYGDATTGTVAAGSVEIGATVGGGDYVAVTNYENTKAVGTATALSLASTAVAADTPICLQTVGVAATQAGKAHVELDYTLTADENQDVVAATIPLGIVRYTGLLVAVEISALTAPTSTRQFTVDVQKGSQSSAFATVLSAPIAFTSSEAARQIVAGTFASTALAADDELQVVIAVSGSGTQARGMWGNLWVAELAA